MKLGITGSTRFADYDHFKAVVQAIPVPVTLLVTGGQKGVEGMARQYAREVGLPCLIHHRRREDGDKWLGRRNVLIARDCDNLLCLNTPLAYTTGLMQRIAAQVGRRLNLVPLPVPAPPIGPADYHPYRVAARYGEEI